jgi:L-fuculose-phosphate aldolase
VLLHLAVYKERPDVQAVVHCHPPYATAFAVAREPIPKCVLPEVEVFLGEVPMAEYATPGTQAFADTITPYLRDCNTIILANHGTVTFGPDLEKAYFNSEIIDAYCKILLLARQLGPIHYFSEQQTRELLDIKKRLGYDDIRFRKAGCALCGGSSFDDNYSDFVPTPRAFVPPPAAPCPRHPAGAAPGANGNGKADDMDDLVRIITDQVMAALDGASR